MFNATLSKCFFSEFNDGILYADAARDEILDSLDGNYDINYSLNMQNYYKEYYNNSIDLSIAYVKDNKPVFLLPMFVYKKNSKYIVSSNGEELFEPLYHSSVSTSARKKINKKIYIFLSVLLKSIGASNYYCICKGSKLSLWDEMIMQKSQSDSNKYGYHVDLKLPLSEIRSAIRKSYKPLASKALKIWNYTIHDECSEQMIKDFRELHASVSGRVTRSEKSWLIQAEQVNSGEGFLVFIKDNSILIGAALFLYNKENSIYAVAAYRREYFDLPIGHAVQILAIEHLKSKNVSDYFIGSYHAPWSEGVTEKELAIEDFKKGFSTYSKINTVFKMKV